MGGNGPEDVPLFFPPLLLELEKLDILLCRFVSPWIFGFELGCHLFGNGRGHQVFSVYLELAICSYTSP